MQDQRIFPNIWCNGNAEEAGEFYAAAIPRTVSVVEARYPSEGLLDFQRDMAGKALTVAVTIGDTLVRLINAGPEFRPNPSISFILNFDPLDFGGDVAAARASLDVTWAALSAGGEVLMPLGEYPFSAHYGWVQDRYGVSWQLMLTKPEGDPRPFVVPSLLFSGAAQNRAAEAIDRYVALLGPDAAAGHRFPYGAATGPATPEAIMFGEFRVGDQWISAMDSGVEMDAPFTNGVSLQVNCADQAEIDRLWDALSAVPEAEQCGWLVDPFGVSWQIVPANMGELMQRPNAYEHMMGMKKLVIADF
ncbi:VOC family protein [Leucobacter sp. CSA2]|uniref:VOC family protein n=1 Tax=Leucobacter edaphi TaxID=2796472 RepID=A0A934QAG0_9MICO|nr:VOC family protein [Leucobacter edaphi]MBK0420926.1 VOC family protein [Leucobacter edaphi]